MDKLLIIVFICLLTTGTAEARMYQWQDPESGTTHFSGKPPTWYRTGKGPRVIVFERGYVIDDTRIEISGEAAENLRLQAITRAEEDRELARQKARAAEEMKARLGTETDSIPPMQEPGELLSEPEEMPVNEEVESADSGEAPVDNMTVDDMRALIQEWETRQTESARETVEREGY